MNRVEAENYVYESYMKAEKYWKYTDDDSAKRNPMFSKDIIQNMGMKPAITVTGSKGKGSVVKMIEQILTTLFKVGTMTSPHIATFNERFCVNGKMITDEEFIDCAEETKRLFEGVATNLKERECISPIGIQCVMALLFFRNRQTDINVFECGKGVKYDDVNNIPHEYAVINTVFLEHTRELGDSLKKIADDKANIITGNEKCVYFAEQTEEVLNVLIARAEAKNVSYRVYGKDYYATNIRFTSRGMIFDAVIGEKEYNDLLVPLLGEHQVKNCVLALAVCSNIIDLDKVMVEIKRKMECLKWPGRMEILSQNPFVLLDACINRESAYNVDKIMDKLGISEMVAIVGIPDDKDYLGVIDVIRRRANEIILTKSSNAHYIFTESQIEQVRGLYEKVKMTDNVNSAYTLAKMKNMPIIILGTTSLIADVKRELIIGDK